MRFHLVTGATVTVKAPTKHKLQPLGPDLWNTTYYPKLRDAVANHKQWYIIDAEGQTLGRLAVLAACVLRCLYIAALEFASVAVVICFTHHWQTCCLTA